MSFAHPAMLVFLLAIPVSVAAHLWFERRRLARASAWARPALLPNMVSSPPSWGRHLPTALLLLGATLLLVGFARPKAEITVKRQNATVIVVLDVSGSMAAQDSQPTRLGASRTAVARYIDELPKGYRMSLITFSDHTTLLSPPTHDLDSVRAALARAHTGPQGTALADAVARAVGVAKTIAGPPGPGRPPASIVLFSDGGQTAGRITPQQAAQRARAAGIPITAVVVGTRDGVVRQQVRGGFSERIEVPVQPDTLQLLSRSSGGRLVYGIAGVDPKATYDELGSRVGHTRKTVEVTALAAGGGLAFLLAGAFASGIWFRRLV
jgi:Ca-activated chloride channel family protein